MGTVRQIYVIMEFRYMDNVQSLVRDDVISSDHYGQAYTREVDAQAVCDEFNLSRAQEAFEKHDVRRDRLRAANERAEATNEKIRENDIQVPLQLIREVPEYKSIPDFLAELRDKEGWVYPESWDLIPKPKDAPPQILTDDGLSGSIEVTDELRQKFSEAGTFLLVGDLTPGAVRTLFSDLPADHPLMQPVEPDDGCCWGPGCELCS